MSLSPTGESTSEEVRQYDVGWAATNKLIRQGKSFSGRERHCAFLNLGADRRFATVSGATGLDLIDDGRGLALSDWDFDGKVDFWLTNRTGPRVRFLHNRFDSGNSFAALRLEGVTANRDAIGARVTVELDGGERLSRTVYAGSGFLSQSSKWLHFGVPAGRGIAGVTVRWPGGELEAFDGVAAGGFYALKQGAGAAAAWDAPRYESALFDVAPIEPPRESGAARVLPVRRPPMPGSLTYIAPDGSEQPLSSAGTPLLVVLWATWCPTCKIEMAQWKGAAEAVRNSGLEVLPLCADEPGEDRAADLAKATAAAAERAYPWQTGLANARLIEHLNIMQKSYIGRQADLPLPSAFLFDGAGALAAIYKGPVDPAVVLADLELARGGEAKADIVARALPFPGKWLETPPSTMPRKIPITLVEHGLTEEAKLYLEQILPLYAEPSPDADEREEEVRVRELDECHTFLGAIESDEGDYSAAVARYLSVIERSPENRKVREELIRCYLELKEPGKAADQLRALLEDRPDDYENLARLGSLQEQIGDRAGAARSFRASLALQGHPETHNALANLLRNQGRADDAVLQYRKALELQPGWPLPANNLAWILATHPDPSLRDGEEALRWAQAAVESTGSRIPQLISTLAAAQAEAGDFAAAEATVGRAIALAEGRDEGLAERLRTRQQQFARGEPVRDQSLLPDVE